MLQTNQNHCGICKDLIPLVQDNVANESSRKFVLEHIAHCEKCRNEYDSYSALPVESADELKDKKTIKKAKLLIWISAAVLLLLGVYLGVDISTTGSRLVFLVPSIAFVILSVIRCKENIKRMIWVISLAIGFIAAYFIWSNIAFFEYDVGSWVAEYCTFFAAFICIASAYFKKNWFASFTFAGYNIGIIAAGLFGQVSYDPGGGLLHNGLLIWVFVLISLMLLGGIIEIIVTAKNKKSAVR